ncbi:MAG: monofunctional biosynthetic peptidoglycan transglycosylase [Pseudomonadota bacterium]
MSRAKTESGVPGTGGDPFDSLRDRVTRRAREREDAERRGKDMTIDDRASALGLDGPKSVRSKARAPAKKGGARRTTAAAGAKSAKGRKAAPKGTGRGARAKRSQGPVGRAFARLGRMIWLGFRWLAIGVATVLIAIFLTVVALRWIDPPMGTYMLAERLRLGGITADWRPMEEMGPYVARSAVAAEDARFCMHNGVDIDELREAAADYVSGERVRGASTISQQTAKNMFLWHGRSLLRKGLELPFVGLMELFWGKERILEVYLNIAEFDTGVFGIEAAAQHYYGRPAAALSHREAARMMMLLPNPKGRDPRALSAAQVRRADRFVVGGARTIAARGDDSCFMK